MIKSIGGGYNLEHIWGGGVIFFFKVWGWGSLYKVLGGGV